MINTQKLNVVHPTIGTHSGSFHADDVAATAVLRMVFQKLDLPSPTVVRTRDRSRLAECTVVQDVGGSYDVEQMRFDHHQSDSNLMRDNGVPYASFGLVWRHFCEVLVSPEVAHRLDISVVQPIDAADNGQITYETVVDGVAPVTLQHLISSFLPEKGKTSHSDSVTYNAALDEGFANAVILIQGFIERSLAHFTRQLAEEDFIIDTYNQSANKEIIVFSEEVSDSRSLKNYPEPIYVVTKRSSDDTWGIRAVEGDKPFSSRKPFPQSWRGKESRELQQTVDNSEAIFCHKAGFLCVAKTQAAAIKLAQLALIS